LPIAISFDKKLHKYTCSNGVVLPNVTDIIKAVKKPYIHLPPRNPEFLKWEGERGTAIHKAIQFDLQGSLDQSTITGIIEPYFRSWLHVKKHLNIRVVCIEKIVYSLRMGFCGTMDLRALVDIPGYKKDVFATIDFKSSKNWWDHFKYQPPIYMLGWYENQYYAPKEKKLESVGSWLISNTSLCLPNDYLSELFIVILLKEDGSFPTLKIFPKEGDAQPYGLVKESLELLAKYHEMNGGWNPEKLFGAEYA